MTSLLNYSLRRFSIVEWLVIGSIFAIFAILGHGYFMGYCGSHDGLAAAEADIAANRLGLKTGGRPGPWRERVVRVCKEQYKIELDRYCGCSPSEYQSAFLRTYNQRMTARIAEIHPDFNLYELVDVARKEHYAVREP